MKTVIEMAREAGFDEFYPFDSLPLRLNRFAELVRADALVKPCCGDFDKCQQICMPRAAAQEREALAKRAEQTVWAGKEFAAAIRARSNK